MQCRAEEQNASVFGKDAKAVVLTDDKPAKPLENQPRFNGMADTPNERLTTVLRAHLTRTATTPSAGRTSRTHPPTRTLTLAEEALDIAGGQDRYLSDMVSPASEAAKALGDATETAPWGDLHEQGKTMFRFSNAWTTDVVEAKTLAMFAYMLKAKRVMEIGMFTGYGALTIAEVLPADGKMVSCEIDPFLKEFSKPFFDKSAHGHKVDVQIGPALETMRGYPVAAEGGFDMIFIDADKGGYAAYYEAALSTPGLLNEGGVIVVDNTLFKGQAWLAPQAAAKDYASWNAGGTAIEAFNQMVKDDARVEQVTLPVRDGITIVRRAGGLETVATPTAAAAPAPVPAPLPTPAAPVPVAAAPVVEVVPTKVVEGGDAVMRGVGGKRILDRMRLDGKAALVTGAGQGIGRAFAHALVEAGASVMVVDLELSRAQAVAAELAQKGGESCAVAFQANVAEEAQVKAMVEAAVARFGGLHIAVNNAGVNKNSAAEDTPMAEFDMTFGVNTRGVFMCCQHEARHMLKSGGGKIINTASMASLIVPHPQKQAAYNASKSAVVKLTQSLGCEWASQGVNVNCISPGIVDTPLIWDNPALKPLAERWVADMPIGKLCDVTDLQAAIVYLASEASDYMVGHNLVIEGGQSLW